MSLWPFTHSGDPVSLDDCRAELSKQRKRADDNDQKYRSTFATLAQVRGERDRARSEVGRLTEALNDKYPPTLPRAEPMVVAGCSTRCRAGTLAGECQIAHWKQQVAVLVETEGGQA